MTVPDGMALVPVSGELVDLADAPAVAKAAHQIRELEAQLRVARAALEWALVQESIRQGKKTLHLGGYTAVVSGGNELQWDIEILQELLDAGLPSERYADLVTEEISHKVSAAIAKQLEAANPAYAEIIGRARAAYPKPQRVSVKEGK